MPGVRGPKVSPEVKLMIMNAALTSTKKRTELAEELHEKLTSQGIRPPSHEYTVKLISQYRNDKTSQDRPWSMASLEDFPLSPEAIPAVLKVWKFRMEKGSTFTIREAKWAARLSLLGLSIERLSMVAYNYARQERIYELINRPFDSTYLDRALMGLPVAKIAVDAKSYQWLIEQGVQDQFEVQKKSNMTGDYSEFSKYVGKPESGRHYRRVKGKKGESDKLERID
jgi:hypothetical protein